MRLLLFSAALLAGCAHAPTVSQSLQAAEVDMKRVDVRIDADADEWSDLTDEAIGACMARTLTTEEAREQCLGIIAQGDAVSELAAEIRAEYDTIATALSEAQASAAKLEALHQQAREEANQR